MERKIQKQKFLSYYFQKWNKVCVGYKLQAISRKKLIQLFFYEWYLIHISSGHYQVSDCCLIGMKINLSLIRGNY
jgi:hypothetical protein